MTQKCKRCILDDNFPGISFDHHGICNYCRNYEKTEARFHDKEKNRKRFEEITKIVKRDGEGNEYDCIQGVSGGRDSTYCLYLLKEYGLNPVAVHFDNNMNSKIAAENIKKVCKKLDVDLHTFTVDWEEYRDLQISFFKASVPSIDIPMDHAFVTVLYNFAIDNNIKNIFSGYNFRGEGPIPPQWTCFDESFILDVFKKFGTRRLNNYPSRGIRELIRYRLKGLRIICPLNYLNVSYEEMMPFMEKELDWQWYGGHHFESVFSRWAFAYYLPEKFGIDKRVADYSVMVRSGQINRERALDMMDEKIYSPEQEGEDRRYIMNKLGISDIEMEMYLSSPPRANSDYKHHSWWYRKVCNGLLGPRHL